MEDAYDWFTTANYIKYFKKQPPAARIEWKRGSWGVKLTPDGKFRDGVPRLYIGEEAGFLAVSHGSIF